MDKHKSASFTWIYVLGLIVALAAGGVGLYLVVKGTGGAIMAGAALLASGSVGLVMIMVTIPIAMTLDSARHVSGDQQQEFLTTISERLQQVSVLLNLISEQQLLSDRAKAVAFREKDRDAIRRAIREEISRQDFEAAIALANDIETQFGYKQEADRFREEIVQKRGEIIHRQVAEQAAVIERHVNAEQWGLALREAERVAAMFPGEDAARRLPQDVENKRQAYKQSLLTQWHDAGNRHDVDGQIEILKKLDIYLTPAEAEQLQEAARGVFKEKLNNLKTEFSIAVQDHKFADAVRIGEGIVRDFPNSRLAQEITEKMEALRERAANEAKRQPEMAKA